MVPAERNFAQSGSDKKRNRYMRINIGTKLSAGFLLITFLMIAMTLYIIGKCHQSLYQSMGQNSIFLAEEMLRGIDRAIYLHIEQLQTHLAHSLLQQTVSDSNKAFERLDDIEAFIDRKDGEWVSAPKDEITPFMKTIDTNALSKDLKKEFIQFYQQKYGYRVFGVIFVTNKYGANVALTGKTTDYRQNDEKWWQVAKESGFYVSDVLYDKSSGTHGIGIGIRVDDEGGDFIGVMMALLNIKEIIRNVEVEEKRFKTTRIKLLTQNGRYIYRTKVFKFLEDVSGKGFFKQIKGPNGFFIDKAGGRERLYSFARSKGYRDFEGLGWIIVVGHDAAEVLSPSFRLRSHLMTASFIFFIAAILLAFLISRSITKPIRTLRKGVEIIGHGNLGHRVNVETTDEIGTLAEVFNQMAEKRQHAEDELKKYRDHLEGLVGERTTALQKANKKLQQKIDEQKVAKDR
jgi:HAMP domain-containing protein